MPLSPRNELETLLAAVHAGEVDPEDFVACLLDLQVFMPIRDEKHQIAGFQTSTQAEPLIVEVEDEQRVVILFSAPERAKAFLTQFPGYSGGLLTEFAWILRRMADDMGIALNPGEEDGFDFDAEMIAMMASLLPDEQ
ncbi:MAG: SseB family protein [Betaproteobacteria bacterium]|nr:SseB family protein [Betaproteobacteria bacterium]